MKRTKAAAGAGSWQWEDSVTGWSGKTLPVRRHLSRDLEVRGADEQEETREGREIEKFKSPCWACTSGR